MFAVLVSYVRESKSLPSYIPSTLGASIFIFGVLSLFLLIKEKLFMRLNFSIGLSVLLGGFSVLGSVFSGTLIKENGLSSENFSSLFTTVTGANILTLYIQSFIFTCSQRENDIANTDEVHV